MNIMKQLCFLTMLFSIFAVSAQHYDERDLLGTWTVTEQIGEINNCIRSFEKITFGETTYDHYVSYSESENEWRGKMVMITSTGVLFNATTYSNSDENLKMRTNPTQELVDYLITNDNKLHLQFSDFEQYYMRFVIKKMTKDEMVLENYAGTCELTLTKEEESKVADIKTAQEEKPEYYTLDGIKVSNPGKGIYVKKENQKSKVLIK